MLLKEVSAFMFVTIACLSAEYVESILECQPATDVSFRQCLELSDDDIQDVPQPVVLTSSEDKFICAGQAPQFFFFSCTLYGNEAVWFFNEGHVTSYQNNDTIDDTQSTMRRQLSDDPSYTLTTTLELVEHETIYNTSRCISTLTVRPSYLNESQPNLPFNVTCLTTCLNQTLNATVCLQEEYRVAETPMQPQNLQRITPTTNQTAVNLKWDPPSNQDDYELEYYTVTLDGREPQISLCTSYDIVVEEEGNYTVNVTVTNSCGQESVPAMFTFYVPQSPNGISTTDPEIINSAASTDLEQIISNLRNKVTNTEAGLGASLGLVSLITIIIITIIGLIYGVKKCYSHRTGSQEVTRELSEVGN